MKIKNYMAIALVATVAMSAGAYERKAYPVPRMTPEVQRLKAERQRWHAPMKSRAAAELPKSVDNSKSKYFPPLIDQQGGSCAQASGIGYMFTYEMNRLLDRDASAGDNNTFHYMFTWNFLNGGVDEGGFVEDGLNIAEKFGVMTTADFGYASTYSFKWATGFDKYIDALHYRAAKTYSFNSTTPAGIEEIKQYLYDKGDGHEGGGIVSFSTLSSDWKMDDNYSGPSLTGYHSILTKLATEGAHALTIVGYDDTVESTDAAGKKHTGAFIVVNSWGSYSHDNGRYYMPYYFFDERGADVTEVMLSSDMTGVDARLNEPKVVFKIGMTYSSRDDISIVLGASQNAGDTQPIDRYQSVLFYNQGGDYPMQGNYTSDNSIEFALDYTDRMPKNYEPVKYFVNIVRSQRGKVSGEGKLDYLSVVDYRSGSPVEYVCEQKNVDLVWGSNWFSIPVRLRMLVSASPYHWRSGATPSANTYVVRTATGKYAKMRVAAYDSASGKLTLQYTYQPNGTTSFAN